MYAMFSHQQPCAVNKSYIQQPLEVTKRTEHFRSITTLNCKSKYVIYLLECTKCKIRWNMLETEVNIRLNNHRKDVWKPDAIPASLQVIIFRAKATTSTHMRNSY